jgi:hypothetical protein
MTRQETASSVPRGLDTVEIRTELFTPLRGGEHWEWREAETATPRTRAHVTSEAELVCRLAMHGPQMAFQLASTPVPVFRVTAHCLTTAALVGDWTWERNSAQAWLPVEPPWAIWDDRLRLEAIARAKRAQYERDGHPDPGQPAL